MSLDHHRRRTEKCGTKTKRLWDICQHFISLLNHLRPRLGLVQSYRDPRMWWEHFGGCKKVVFEWVLSFRRRRCGAKNDDEGGEAAEKRKTNSSFAVHIFFSWQVKSLLRPLEAGNLGGTESISLWFLIGVKWHPNLDFLQMDVSPSKLSQVHSRIHRLLFRRHIKDDTSNPFHLGEVQ